jgi:hypothetical protein
VISNSAPFVRRRQLLLTMKAFLIVLAVFVSTLAALFTCHYFLLWKPSLEGKCGGTRLGEPSQPKPHVTHFKGEVVGQNLWILQYRWLRRRFKAVGTTLSLARELPSTVYQGNVVLHGERVADVTVGKSGSFDFGSLPPGEYSVLVTYPGEDAVSFGFIIDPSARNSGVLIDASPAYYCFCCGRDLEVR